MLAKGLGKLPRVILRGWGVSGEVRRRFFVGTAANRCCLGWLADSPEGGCTSGAAGSDADSSFEALVEPQAAAVVSNSRSIRKRKGFMATINRELRLNFQGSC